MNNDNQRTFRNELWQQCRSVFGNYRFLFHIGIWALVAIYMGFFQLPDLSRGFDLGVKETTLTKFKLTAQPLFRSGILWGCATGGIMIYFFLLIAIPFARYKMRKRYLWLALLGILAIWSGVIVMVVLIPMAHKTAEQLQEEGVFVFVGMFASVSLMLVSSFLSIYYFLDLYDQQKGLNRYQRVFTDKLQAETNFLRTQINPHFLFNTLNNIYSLALSRSDDAPKITLQLKSLINYMVDDCTQDLVPLEGELEFLRNYIDLEKLRNRDDNVDISLEVKGDAAGKVIAPLLLVNFIENAFKHGVKAGIGQSYVHIRLHVMDRMLDMDVSNSKPNAEERMVTRKRKQKDLAVRQDGGIGIRNVKRRLEILYPAKHKLHINETRSTFNVHLNIRFQS